MAEINLLGIDLNTGQTRPIASGDVSSNADGTSLFPTEVVIDSDGELLLLEYSLPAAVDGGSHIMLMNRTEFGITATCSGSDGIRIGGLAPESSVITTTENYSHVLLKPFAGIYVVKEVTGIWELSGSSLVTNNEAYWRFTTGALTDSSGNSRTLTQNGTVTYANAGIFDQAATFNNNSANYLTAADAAVFDPGGTNFSVSVWVKPTGFNGDTGLVNKNSWSVGHTGGGIPYFTAVAGGGPEVYNGGGLAMTLNDWNHVLFRRNGTSWQVYLDGSLHASVTSSASITDNANALHIGRSVAGNPYQGDLDEISFFSRALTNAEIAALYNSGNGLAFGAYTLTGVR